MKKKFQIPLRTPQRPQPVSNPYRVFVHFSFCLPFHTYAKAYGSQTLLRLFYSYLHALVEHAL